MPDDRVTREVFWNISLSGELAFYALAFLSLGLFGYGVSRHFEESAQGQAHTAVMENDPSQPGKLRFRNPLKPHHQAPA